MYVLELSYENTISLNTSKNSQGKDTLPNLAETIIGRIGIAARW